MRLFSKPSKVKRNIMVSMAVFAVITLVVLWFFQFIFLRNLHIPIRTATVEQSAEMVARAIGTPDIRDVVQNVSKSNDVCIRILNEDGSDIFLYENTQNCQIHDWDASKVQRLYVKTIENGGEYSNKDKKDLGSIVCGKIVNHRQGQFFILVEASLLPINSIATTLKYQFVFLVVGFIIMALIITWVLSRTISRPLTQLNNQAKRLAKGDYSVRFEGEGLVELEELSDTLNYATEELQKVDKLKDELIANISHDLRTPLTLITGYGEVMRDIPGENTPENIQVIIDEAQHLSEIVNELLDLSKLRSGEIPIVKESFDCNSFLEKILDRYKKLTELEGYKFTFDNQIKKPVFVNADIGQIERVVCNLINNAINYTGEDRCITIRQVLTEDRGDTAVRIEVIDTGDGIPQEDIEHIWERYYRSKDEHKRASIGSGLGLSIVKVLLDLHEAKFGVRSSSSGSIFWFELKCSEK